MKKIMMLFLVLLMAMGTACADTVETLAADVFYDATPILTGDGVCVTLAAADGKVQVQIVSGRGNVISDKNYGTVSGPFTSDVIYLSEGGYYTLTVIAGNNTYVVPFELQRGTAPLPTEYGWMDGSF